MARFADEIPDVPPAVTLDQPADFVEVAQLEEALDDVVPVPLLVETTPGAAQEIVRAVLGG